MVCLLKAKSQLHVTDSNLICIRTMKWVYTCVYKYILSKFTLYYSDIIIIIIIIIRNETAILLVYVQ